MFLIIIVRNLLVDEEDRIQETTEDYGKKEDKSLL